MLRVACLLWFGWASAASLEAQPVEEAAAQLASRIISLLPRRTTVLLELQNSSAMAANNSSSFRLALENELRKAGLQMADTQPEARLRVTISENPGGPLFVAELSWGENRQVLLLPWRALPFQPKAPPLKITRSPVWEQAEPILDILLLNSNSELIVLSQARISIFRLVDGKWMPAGGAAIPVTRPPARDPRGRLQVTAGGFRAFLPGTSCGGVLQPELKLTCAGGNETWPADPRDPNFQVAWISDRNLLESNRKQGNFYSAGHDWFATVDSRIASRAGESLSGSESWGSDFTAIENPCALPSTVLASARGDSADRDQVQAYQIETARAEPASEPILLPGPVTALWPAETARFATLVFRNSKTGNYEASRLGLACAE